MVISPAALVALSPPSATMHGAQGRPSSCHHGDPDDEQAQLPVPSHDDEGDGEDDRRDRHLGDHATVGTRQEQLHHDKRPTMPRPVRVATRHPQPAPASAASGVSSAPLPCQSEGPPRARATPSVAPVARVSTRPPVARVAARREARRAPAVEAHGDGPGGARHERHQVVGRLRRTKREHRPGDADHQRPQRREGEGRAGPGCRLHGNWRQPGGRAGRWVRHGRPSLPVRRSAQTSPRGPPLSRRAFLRPGPRRPPAVPPGCGRRAAARRSRAPRRWRTPHCVVRPPEPAFRSRLGNPRSRRGIPAE